MKKKNKNADSYTYLIGIAALIVFSILMLSTSSKTVDKPGDVVNRDPAIGDNSNYEGKEVDDEGNRIDAEKGSSEEDSGGDDAPDNVEEFEDIRVHYLNVGQADSALIEFDGKVMLIDAGNNPDGKDVVKYIHGLGYESVDILIGTHPHEDHIGGLDDVVDSLDIKNIYMPKLKDANIPTTKTYKDVLTSISKKGYSVTSPSIKEVIYNSNTTKITVVNDTSTAHNINDYSIAVKIDYKDVSFVFTGDLEGEGEARMVDAFDLDLSAEIYKAGHHGSKTSSTQKFLDRMNPEVGIISAGENNQYGHPHKEILTRFRKMNMDIFQTSKDGTIMISSNGQKYKVFKGVTGEIPMGEGWDGFTELPSSISY